MTIDQLIDEDLYSMELHKDLTLDSGTEVWINKYNNVTVLLNNDRSVQGYHIKEPYQLLIPFKEYVNDYVSNLLS